MSKLKEFLKNPHIQIALATGFSIIIMAYFSKRVLTEPIRYLHLAIPPFIATIFESLLAKHKDSKFMKIWYWVVAILIATALVIILSAV
jgi:hypothetical protein